MSGRPPFDPVRASFWLVAFVIGVHCIVVLAGAGFCAYEKLQSGPPFVCDPQGRLSDLLAGVLAAAIAFSGGLRGNKRDPPDPPK